VFDKILNELKEFKFAPDRQFINDHVEIHNHRNTSPFTENQPLITLMGFMEPMSDIKLLKRRVKQIKDTLPGHIEIASSTSGDYFSKKNLEKLYLTTLNIMDYDHKGENYWIDELGKAGCLIIDNIGEIIATHKNIGLITVKPNWKDNVLLEDRAGVLSENEPVINQIVWKNNKQQRIVPCPEPSYFINITHDGSVMPCCHIRSDIPMHKDYIFGNVKNNTLLEILNSPKAVEFRQRLTVERGDYPTPCKTCQKVRHGLLTGAPNGFVWSNRRYDGNQINESVIL
jgi:radical SAM protein with 4Fe4S-binding SPASM domain